METKIAFYLPCLFELSHFDHSDLIWCHWCWHVALLLVHIWLFIFVRIRWMCLYSRRSTQLMIGMGQSVACGRIRDELKYFPTSGLLPHYSFSDQIDLHWNQSKSFKGSVNANTLKGNWIELWLILFLPLFPSFVLILIKYSGCFPDFEIIFWHFNN